MDLPELNWTEKNVCMFSIDTFTESITTIVFWFACNCICIYVNGRSTCKATTSLSHDASWCGLQHRWCSDWREMEMKKDVIQRIASEKADEHCLQCVLDATRSWTMCCIWMFWTLRPFLWRMRTSFNIRQRNDKTTSLSLCLQRLLSVCVALYSKESGSAAPSPSTRGGYSLFSLSFVHCSPTKCQVVHQFPCHKHLNWNTLYPASKRFVHTQMNVYFFWVLLHN